MRDRVFVVFGGGGVKGMAHAGAFRAIEESGLVPDELIGTSIGGLVAACLGAGRSWQWLAERASLLKKQDIVALNRWALLLNGIRQPSVFQGEPLRTYIASLLPVERFDQLVMPVSMNAVDLETGEMVWFGAGGRTDVSLVDAIYATCALPVFYPPALIDDGHFVDGGVRDGLPIDLAATRGASLIIAIDVGAGEVRDAGDTVAKGMVSIHHRVTEIMGHARKKLKLASWSGPRLVYVRPQLNEYSTFDFGKTEHFLEEGYRSTRAALDEAGFPAIAGRARQAR